ncbi:MAG: isopentenyl-diphosphate Delta-isomerase [Pseudomonadota bacterium]
MTELLPAWRSGVLTPVEKLAVHQLGLRHKAVSVFVVSGTQLLLQQRAAVKYHTPGLWANACCTHPRWDEDPKACAVRRLREELGITGLAPRFRQQVEYRADVGGGLIEHEVVDLFVAEVKTPETVAVNPNPAEVAAFRWIELTALRQAIAEEPEHYTPWLRIYLDRHGAEIFDETSCPA